MAISITIEGLDDEVLERLRAEARRRHVGIDVVIKELLGRAFPPASLESSSPPYHDLDHLAGTWSDEQADAMLAAVSDFETVDEDLWK